MRTVELRWLTVAMALSALVSGGCGEQVRPANAASASASTVVAAPGVGVPVSVITVRARASDVDVTIEATGTVTPLNSVEMRPQISNVITGVHIREGQFVTAGQLLFTLDSRNDEVIVAKAKAVLAKDMAALADAQRQLRRSLELLEQNFISQGAVDTTQTLVNSQQAIIVSDQAAINAAQVGLSYNRIVAPSAGRAGAINLFVGSTVQPGGVALVTITRLHPIAVSFNLPQRNLGDALRMLRAGGGKVVAVLPEGAGVTTGKLHFVDNVVEANSGTVRVKAEFANPSEILWPGAFVTVQLAVRRLKNVVTVPQAAVIQGPRGSIVYTVGADNKAVARRIDVLYATGPDAVASGVSAGERVVVEGRQNLRAGVVVVERAPLASAEVGRAARTAPGASEGSVISSAHSSASAGASAGAGAGSVVAR